MNTKSKHSLKIPLKIEQDKGTDKKGQLKKYLSGLKFHPPVKEHYLIAKSFGVGNYKPIFKADAVNRFLTIIGKEPTTAATVSKLTGITHKYLCQLKRSLEKEERLKVIGIGRCETTGSMNVQYLSSNFEEVVPENDNVKNC